jgi:hypothetical protein
VFEVLEEAAVSLEHLEHIEHLEHLGFSSRCPLPVRPSYQWCEAE